MAQTTRDTDDIAAGLSIGQVAGRTGLSVHALRFYEREGILAEAVQRAPGGRRVYGEHDLEWLEVCIKLRASDMPLPEIRRYAELVRAGSGNETERLSVMRAHQERIRARIADLEECLDLIGNKIESYEASLLDGGSCVPWESARIPETVGARDAATDAAAVVDARAGIGVQAAIEA